MNKYKFIIKFITSKDQNGRYKWNLLFPFLGVIIGSMTVSLTLSIMEGMENAIFTKLENISFPAKLINISSKYSSTLEDYLNSNNILFQHGSEDQIVLIKESDFRLVTLHGIENFKHFKNIVLKPDPVQNENIPNKANIFIGRPLAIKLDLNLGDTVSMLHPDRINIFTGLPDARKVIVGGIFNLNILNYDQKHIFYQYSDLNNFLPDHRELLYLNNPLNVSQLSFIQKQFADIDYKRWDEDHLSFISAMKLEKFTYALIGFIIIAIAGFTLMSMMSLSVMQKVPQIGILRAIGMQSYFIRYIFIFQAVITSLISSAIGILLSIIIIEIDDQYNLLQSLFWNGSLFFDFPLILNNQYIIIIFFISLILLIMAGLYPSLKAARLDPVEAIGFKR